MKPLRKIREAYNTSRVAIIFGFYLVVQHTHIHTQARHHAVDNAIARMRVKKSMTYESRRSQWRGGAVVGLCSSSSREYTLYRVYQGESAAAAAAERNDDPKWVYQKKLFWNCIL